MSEPLPRPWTVDDFLAWEAQQEERYEFIDGVIVAMVGGSVAHATIKGNIHAALRARLRGGPCRPIIEGPKVVTATSSHYPDLIVTCSPVNPSDEQIREPAAIIEVLSRTTADRDRGAKWVAYQDVPSLRHYLLVAQDRRRVDVFTRRGAAGWQLEVIRPPATEVPLPAFDVTLTLDEIYEESGT